MEILKETKEEVQILFISGEINLYNATDLKEALDELIDSGNRFIAVNLKKVEYIDSSGIGVFISARNKLLKYKGKICFFSLQDSIKNLFELTKLTNLFPVFENEKESVSALRNS